MSSGAKRTSLGGSATLPIKVLSSHTAKWKVEARVLEKSAVTTFNRKAGGGEGKIFSCVLGDHEGTTINAKFWGKCADDWVDKIEKGRVYTFTRGRIGLSNKRYSGGVDHNYEIVFDRDADITLVEEPSHDIPTERNVIYTSLRNISQSPKKMPFSANILVVVHTFQPLRESMVQGSNEPRKRRNVTVVDATGKSVDVTLWGNHAEVEDDILSRNPVAAFINVQIREWRGRAASTINGTEIIWDPKSDDAVELKLWYTNNVADTIFDSLTQGTGADGTGEKIVPVEATVCEIRDAVDLSVHGDSTVFKLNAMIAGTLYRNARQENALTILYSACSRCNRKLVDNTCKNCTEPTVPTPRLALQVLLADHTGSGLSVRVFHDQALQIVGLPIKQLETLAAADNGESSEIEEIFDYHVKWKRMTFTIRGRRDTYQGETRNQFVLMTANNMNPSAVVSSAMQKILRTSPTAFDPIQAVKRVFVDADEGASSKRARVSENELSSEVAV